MVAGVAVSKSLASGCVSAAAELWLASGDWQSVVNYSEISGMELQFFLGSLDIFCFWQMKRISLMASFLEAFW